eukprot:scaffold23830_cov28-Tisochrysis_lutea.AAC.1
MYKQHVVDARSQIGALHALYRERHTSIRSRVMCAPAKVCAHVSASDGVTQPLRGPTPQGQLTSHPRDTAAKRLRT